MRRRIAFAVKLLEVCCAELRGDEEAEASLREQLVALADGVADEPEVEAFARLQLSPSEELVLTLLIAAATDLPAHHLLSTVAGRDGVTLSVLRHIAYRGQATERAALELSANGALRSLSLIERSDGDANQHESKQRWVVASRIVDAVLRIDIVDPQLASIAAIVPPGSSVAELCATREAQLRLREAVAAKPSFILVTGLAGLGRRTLVRAAAGDAGLRLLEIDARHLAVDVGMFGTQMRQLARECLLLGCAPLLRNIDALDDSTEKLAAFELFASKLPTHVFATSSKRRSPSARWSRPSIVVELTAPTSPQRAVLWGAALAQGTPEDAEFLATHYPMAPALICCAAKAAHAQARGHEIKPEDIYAGIRTVLDDKLGDYAKRVEVTQTWDDLVLPADQMEAVQYLIARIRQRRTVYEQWGFAAKVGKGLGTSALFSGPPGTGKTMVAALIAKDLGLELYQVDMAKITSKYIGETERNLAALFDAAEAGHAILLFDEADSLFGKRTEVKSSNDRYANLETNYLLQRLESFTGICLLTSNHESNIDPAFQRRLSLHVRFEVPDVDERESLWRAMLPAAAPVASDVDFMKLARKFAMTGGYIRNAAMRAAFLAADEGSDITGSHLERAARLEYEGMGKIAAF